MKSKYSMPKVIALSKRLVAQNRIQGCGRCGGMCSRGAA